MGKGVFLLEGGEEDQIAIFENGKFEMMPTYYVGIWICESRIWQKGLDWRYKLGCFKHWI